jgi:hypothetical protein
MWSSILGPLPAEERLMGHIVVVDHQWEKLMEYPSLNAKPCPPSSTHGTPGAYAQSAGHLGRLWHLLARMATDSGHSMLSHAHLAAHMAHPAPTHIVQGTWGAYGTSWQGWQQIMDTKCRPMAPERRTWHTWCTCTNCMALRHLWQMLGTMATNGGTRGV